MVDRWSAADQLCRSPKSTPQGKKPMTKTAWIVLLFAFLPIICGGLAGFILGACDPLSATQFLELRGSSVWATMLGHGALWGIMISAAQMAVVLVAFLVVQRGKKSVLAK
jgi:hypothetical protein